MRKKDYELIASTIKNSLAIPDKDRYWIGMDFSDQFERVYPKFDRQKFLTACGIEHTHDFTGVVEYPDGSVIVCKVCGEAKD